MQAFGVFGAALVSYIVCIWMPASQGEKQKQHFLLPITCSCSEVGLFISNVKEEKAWMLSVWSSAVEVVFLSCESNKRTIIILSWT